MDEEVFGDLSPCPFWFLDPDLLLSFWLTEINTAAQLLANHPELPILFDIPKPTVAQRRVCFDLLAHRKLIELVEEAQLGRYADLPSLSDVQSDAITRTHNLVPADAPEWAREMKRVVDRLPFRIKETLPGPLQTEGYFPDNEERREAVRSAAAPLSTVEQLQMLVKGVMDGQMHRLAERWSATSAVANPSNTTHTNQLQAAEAGRHVRKTARRRNERGMKRDKLIAEIAGISKTAAEFVRRMDERDVQPQPTWEGWPGTWTAAYRNEHLRKLIHQDKSRALFRAGGRRGK
jgi:hypothetical protein